MDDDGEEVKGEGIGPALLDGGGEEGDRLVLLAPESGEARPEVGVLAVEPLARRRPQLLFDAAGGRRVSEAKGGEGLEAHEGRVGLR